MVAPGCNPPAWLFAERRVERQVHRSQQAGLPDRGHRVGGHHHVRLDRDLDVGMPVRRPSSCPTLPTTTSLIRTGEFDSSVETFGDLDVVGDRVGSPSDRAGQRQGVQALEGATRRVSATHDPTTTTCFSPDRSGGS